MSSCGISFSQSRIAAREQRHDMPPLRGNHQLSAISPQALRAQTVKGGPDDYEPDVYDLIEDEVSKASKAQRKTFKKVALSGTISLADAVERYLHDRREGNGSGYAPLKDTTKNDLRKALWYLCQFMEETEDTLFIDDVSFEQFEKFRGDFLPDQKSPRAPNLPRISRPMARPAPRTSCANWASLSHSRGSGRSGCGTTWQTSKTG